MYPLNFFKQNIVFIICISSIQFNNRVLTKFATNMYLGQNMCTVKISSLNSCENQLLLFLTKPPKISMKYFTNSLETTLAILINFCVNNRFYGFCTVKKLSIYWGRYFEILGLTFKDTNLRTRILFHLL